MKKVFIVVIVPLLLSSCLNRTDHHFYMKNQSTDTLQLYYKGAEMFRIRSIVMEPEMDLFLIDASTYESGTKSKLSNQEIVDHFSYFKFKGDSDLFKLNTETLSLRLSHYIDFDDVNKNTEHHYIINIYDEDLE